MGPFAALKGPATFTKVAEGTVPQSQGFGGSVTTEARTGLPGGVGVHKGPGYPAKIFFDLSLPGKQGDEILSPGHQDHDLFAFYPQRRGSQALVALKLFPGPTGFFTGQFVGLSLSRVHPYVAAETLGHPFRVTGLAA